MLTTWWVTPTCLPLVRRRCPTCAAGSASASAGFRTDGKFRVNAHHKRIDAWLLALCTRCGETAKLTVLERRPVRSVRPALLDRMHANDPALAAELLQDPAVRRRNHVTLDWEGAWRLDTGEPAHPRGERREPLDVAVRFAAPVPVRPTRLIAEGCGLARAEVGRLIRQGRLVSAVRLEGRLSADFTFTLRPRAHGVPLAPLSRWSVCLTPVR
ncbi:DUF1062 domain-containing protein [Streptomyces sp. NPDC046939]|uniref:DUF1062 domain-containing protein n=1 Tax=Streptomyces sp. NPDC046939 TaxID=3155376 RepID=UPI0033C5C13F